MSLFELEKLEIKEGKDSLVFKGESIRGHSLVVTNPERSFRKNLDFINEIEVGQQVLVSRGIREYIITSPIKNILTQPSPTEIVFETQTSIYKLSSIEASTMGYD